MCFDCRMQCVCLKAYLLCAAITSVDTAEFKLKGKKDALQKCAIVLQLILMRANSCKY